MHSSNPLAVADRFIPHGAGHTAPAREPRGHCAPGPVARTGRELTCGGEAMQEQNVEIWAHCAPCTTWFAVPSDTVHALVTTRCQLCGAVPERLEQRLGNLVIMLDVEGGRSPETPLQGVA